MLFSFSLKSSILLIFFFHGIVFSTLLLVKGLQTENKSNLWLSLFTLLCAFYIAPFMFGYAGWYSKQHYRDFLFYVPFQQLFLLPPVLYFYIKTLLDKSFQFSTKDYIHFLPATIYLIYSFIIFIVDKAILNEYYFYNDGNTKVYCASADWMGRNLFSRIETCFPIEDKKLRKQTPYEYRYYLNYCTFNYSMSWWDWSRWEKEIDWMALHGINMPLAITGEEYTWYLLYKEMGFSDDELKGFFTGPAYFSWFWMGNIDGWGGPLPVSWMKSHFELQKKILNQKCQLCLVDSL